jgi:hypothetical protein
MLGYFTKDILPTGSDTLDQEEREGKGKWGHYPLPGPRSTNGVVWQGMPV